VKNRFSKKYEISGDYGFPFMKNTINIYIPEGYTIEKFRTHESYYNAERIWEASDLLHECGGNQIQISIINQIQQ
jgi:hypothetical protein